MADVRALLRNERLARRITHPYVTYSNAGTLSCNICNLRLQADALWEPHLAGKVHKQNLARVKAAKSQTSTQSVVSVAESIHQTSENLSSGNAKGKKRKAEEEDEHAAQQMKGKKRKAANSESEEDVSDGNNKKVKSSFQDDQSASFPTRIVDRSDDTVLRRPNDILDIVMAPDVADGSKAIDEAEYAAFEAAIAAAPVGNGGIEQSTAKRVLNSEADIAAAPITAAELASREMEDLNAQRKGKREEEIEEEKEDATRALEEEFDEMDQLEARVKRLKEMREKLRMAAQEEAVGIGDPNELEMIETASKEDSDDDDDNYDDDWNFG